MTIEQTWNNGGYLSGLKGVTIPNNTPSFNEDPRKGRHWSSDNAIQADDESLKGIFASLNSMPTVSQQDVQIPDPQPVSQSQPSEQSVAQQQTTQAIQQSQEAHVFPTTSDRQPVGTGSLQFDEDTDATQQNPAYEEHGPIQQIDSNPPSFVPGATPFAKRQADIHRNRSAADASDHHSHSAGRSFPKAAATATADESAADQAIRGFRSA